MPRHWFDRTLRFALETTVFTAKSLCLFVLTFLIVYVIGTIGLTALFGLLTGAPHLLISRDLSGVPFIYYAFRTALPVAILASGLVWGLATVFAAISKDNTLLMWFIFMLIVGTLVGAVTARLVLELLASDFSGREGRYLALRYLSIFCFLGAFTSSLLSPLWFLAYHRWLSPSRSNQ